MMRFLLAIAASGALVAGGVPKDQVISLLKSGVSESSIKELVKKEGIDFDPTGPTLAEIRAAGGSAGLTVFLTGYQKGVTPLPEKTSTYTGDYAQYAQAQADTRSGKSGGGKFGLQFTIAKPQGDLGDSDFMDGKTGFGIGFHGLADLGGGSALVTRLDYTMYKRSQSFFGASIDYKTDIISGGCDYEYYVSGKANQGFYLLVGLGYASGKLEASVSGPGLDLSVNTTKGSFYYQGGFGFLFSPSVGMELRFQGLNFNNVELNALGYRLPLGDQSAPSTQVSFIFRF